ncbi:glycosyltransferase family 2 protein [Asaia krungthepensis]|uniref:Glycosyl transferase family 2 n=1 Tax=Asaia krungthepensis NRIC 0535 TaxID=1307925 RepID=A0ABQ0PW37_9PROT|nr:glycosyltransferase family 2 protein [Asaia krungthepensis]GBQ83094.1 hypothetical protein AA0535_0159 [Asaia krungthepensis NRIC 0535]
MASTAAILFIRNDADDIGWWIAYHLAVGFDTLIIYDDASTDGTWEVIQTASGLFPIEAHRVTPDDRSFAERRSACLSQAIDQASGRFDWVICLDSDEYVCPQDAVSVPDYLDRFPNADGITLNWSIFGSAGHVKRTREAPLSAYTQRAPLNFADHALGKTFIRPSAYTGHAIDTIHWALDPHRHVHADGTVFDPSRPPNWEGARLLHYVTRNLTRYTSRLASCSPGQKAPDLWSHFNRNDETDHGASRFLPATRDYAARLWRAGLETLYWRLRKDITAQSLSFLPDSALTVRAHRSLTSPPELLLAQPGTPDGRILVCDLSTGTLAVVPPESQSEKQEPVWLVVETHDSGSTSPEASSSGFLMLPETRGAAPALGVTLTHWLPVRVTGALTTETHALVGISLLPEEKPIGLIETETVGIIDDSTPAFCARFRAADPVLLARLRAYLALRGQGETLHDFCVGMDLLRHPEPDAMGCAMMHLDSAARAVLETRYAGLVPPWLYA